MAASGPSMPWTDAEDRLLCAIVHEFGSNWFLVADVLSASCAMQGIYRSPTTLPLPLQKSDGEPCCLQSFTDRCRSTPCMTKPCAPLSLCPQQCPSELCRRH